MQIYLSFFILEGKIPGTYDQIFTYSMNRLTILRSEFTESDQLKANHVGRLQKSFTVIRGGGWDPSALFIFNHAFFTQTVQTHRHNIFSSVWRLLILPEGMLAFVHLEVFLHHHKDKYMLCLSSKELCFWDILSQSWYRSEKLNEHKIQIFFFSYI